jgi:hypothetical protein
MAWRSRSKPDELSFRYERSAAQLAALIIGAAVLFGLLLVLRTSDILGWIEVSLIGLGLALGFIVYVIGPYFFYLDLCPEGLDFRHMGRRRFFEWGEIRNMRLVEKNPNQLDFRKTLVFDLAPNSPQITTLSRMKKSLRNYDVEVPEVFVRCPEELLRLLQSWHDRFAPPDNLPPVETPPDFADQFKKWQQQYGHGKQPPT